MNWNSLAFTSAQMMSSYACFFSFSCLAIWSSAAACSLLERCAGEGGPEEFGDFLGVGPGVLGQVIRAAATGGELRLHLVRVQQHQALPEARVGHVLALAGRVPFRSAEGVEERRADALVRQVDRVRPLGQAAEIRRRLRDTREGVEQDLGRHPFRIVPGETLLILRVVLVRQARQTVEPARADQVGSAPSGRSPTGRSDRDTAFEQLGVARRVGQPHVVQRLDHSPAEEVGPVAVDQGVGEEGCPGSAIQSTSFWRGGSW